MARKESKKETFRRLATQRTNAVLNRLRILGHCSNPHLYDYTEEDVRKIFRAIESEVKAVKAKFVNSSKSDFQL
jgi:poly-gamma-glutamate capsule biosynthesis protein CapA/YwtB (metallophosphatase superfamily)